MDYDATKAINLTLERVWCPTHGEPLRARWPKGHLIAALFMLGGPPDPETRKPSGGLLVEETFSAIVAARTGEKPTDAEWRGAIEATLDEIPACCRVTPEVLIAAYTAAEVSRGRRTCVLCMRPGEGTPAKTNQGSLQHVCFECFARRARRGARWGV